MAEEKPIKPEGKPAPQPTEKLVAKIAQAYATIPAAEREKTLFNTSDAEVENPELDRTFDKLVETYSRRAADRGKGVVHIFPGPAVPSLEPEPEEGEPSEAPSTAAPAPRGIYECPECGHLNPAENRFCGRCGAVREAEALQVASPAAHQHEVEVEVTPKGVLHHHHYYHHHEQGLNKYLALLVLALCLFVGWQQWDKAKALLGISARPLPAAPPPAHPVVAVDKGLQLPAMTVAAPPPSSTAVPTPKPAAATLSKPATVEASFRPAVSTPEAQPAAPVAVPPSTAPVANGTEEPPPISAIRDSLERLAIPAVPMPKAEMPVPSIQRVSQGVVLGEVVRRVPPVYPPLAAKSNIEGSVVVSAKIAKDGSVTDVKASSGHPMLRAAAVEAVKQWKYKPATLGGQPVEVDTTVTITFQRFAPRR